VMRGAGVGLCGIAAIGAIVRRRPGDSLGILAATVATGAVLANALFLQVAPHPAPMMAVKPRPVASDITSSLPRTPPLARRSEVVAPKVEPVIAKPDAIAAKPDPIAAKIDAPSAARTRAIVTDIQRELSRRGFFDGPVDGVYGPKTDAAIRDFEQAAGLKGNSQPDDALLKLIMRSAVHAATPAAPAAAPARTATTTPAPARAAPPAPAAISTPTSTSVPRPPAPIGRAANAAAPAKRIISVQRALADFGYGQVAPTGVMGAETKTAIERFERERKLPVTGQVSDRLLRELAAVTGRPLE
jgi:peptidoglycan hydrolase-like protein with peptidoglycan-binding domain